MATRQVQALEHVVRLGHVEGNKCGHWTAYHNVVAIMFAVAACMLKDRNSNHDNRNICGRVQLKHDGTRRHTGGEVRGKLANGVGSQYSSNYLGTWCIQHYYR